MTTTKHPYLKEILKTTAKVALLAGATVALGAFAFEFGAVYFNTLLAGYLAGGVVATVGTYSTIKTLIKNLTALPKRVAKQKEEEQLNQRFEKIDQKLEQLEKTQQKTQAQTEMPRLLARHHLNPMAQNRRQKQYEDAA